MMVFSRIFFALAGLTGICALIARFVQPQLLLMILPATWLAATAVLLLFSIALSVLAIATAMEKKPT